MSSCKAAAAEAFYNIRTHLLVRTAALTYLTIPPSVRLCRDHGWGTKREPLITSFCAPLSLFFFSFFSVVFLGLMHWDQTKKLNLTERERGRDWQKKRHDENGPIKSLRTDITLSRTEIRRNSFFLLKPSTRQKPVKPGWTVLLPTLFLWALSCTNFLFYTILNWRGSFSPLWRLPSLNTLRNAFSWSLLSQKSLFRLNYKRRNFFCKT